jgi:hypothetical protein
MGQITGMDKNNWGYSVFVDTGFGAAKKVDGQSTLLYIRPLKTRLRRSDPAVLILEQYNPWTLDSLPFLPKTELAQIISRKVPKSVVRMVTKERYRDKTKWRVALQKTGYKEPHKSRKPLKKYPKAYPDVLFEVLRMEFGVGGKPVPAWKPAARWTVKSGFSTTFRKNPKLLKAITDPEFFGWQHWPLKTRRKMPVALTKQSKDFARRLGVHA